MTILRRDTVDFDQLIADVAVYVTTESGETDVSDNRIRAAIRDTYLEFVGETNLIREWILINAQKGVGDYPIYNYMPDGYHFRELYQVNVGGCPYEVTTNLANGRNGNTHETYWIDSADWLHIYPCPPCDDIEIKCFVSVDVDMDACTMDGRTYRKWRTALIDGVLSRLLEIPNTEYYNPSLARLKGREFKKAKSDARASARLGDLVGANQDDHHVPGRYSRGFYDR